MTGLAMLWIFAIGLFVNGISYFFGRFITGPALLMFVFVSIPASGPRSPAWMVPSFFKTSAAVRRRARHHRDDQTNPVRGRRTVLAGLPADGRVRGAQCADDACG